MTFKKFAPSAVGDPHSILCPPPQSRVGRLSARSRRRRSNEARRRRFAWHDEVGPMEDEFLIAAGCAWLDEYFPTDRPPTA